MRVRGVFFTASFVEVSFFVAPRLLSPAFRRTFAKGCTPFGIEGSSLRISSPDALGCLRKGMHSLYN